MRVTENCQMRDDWQAAKHGNPPIKNGLAARRHTCFHPRPDPL
jgi:hypothetical protein